MKHLQQNSFLVLLCFLAITGCNCLHPNTKPLNKANSSNATTEENEPRTKFVDAKSGLKMAFTYPVIEVNGKRAKKVDPAQEEPETIIVTYPENSLNEIEISFIDSEGAERQIFGNIKTFNYSQYSKLEGQVGEVVPVAPEDGEFTYESIYQNGYGQLTVREYIRDPERWEKPGEILATLELGIKKKK